MGRRENGGDVYLVEGSDFFFFFFCGVGGGGGGCGSNCSLPVATFCEESFLPKLRRKWA